MRRVCAGCGAKRGTYRTDCDACQHRRRQTQQQRNRRTGSHIPQATLDGGDVNRLVSLRSSLDELVRRFERARRRSEQEGRPVGPLMRDAIVELAQAIVILDELADGPLGETLASIAATAPRTYRRRSSETTDEGP